MVRIVWHGKVEVLPSIRGSLPSVVPVVWYGVTNVALKMVLILWNGTGSVDWSGTGSVVWDGTGSVEYNYPGSVARGLCWQCGMGRVIWRTARCIVGKNNRTICMDFNYHKSRKTIKLVLFSGNCIGLYLKMKRINIALSMRLC